MTSTTHCTTRRATVAAVALAVTAGTAVGATPASASLETVRAGHNITSVHSIDMVAVSGYGSGAHTVRILGRDNVLKRTETAAPYDIDDRTAGVQYGLELNHGVDDTARDGDCWDAPVDIEPGDTVEVSVPGLPSPEKIVVDDIYFSQRSRIPAGSPTPDKVVVRGIAREWNASGTGAAIPLAKLDNNEFRSVDGKYRDSPESVTRWAGHPGGFVLHYDPDEVDRNRRGLSRAQIVTALMTQNGHATGYGHVDGAQETQFVEGFRASTAAVTADGC